MKFTFRKTDKRYTGYKDWKYAVSIERTGIPMNYNAGLVDKASTLNQVREWCWETYGPSCELEFWMVLPDEYKNDKWCWHTNFNNYKIYLRTDKEANWFKLKWL